MGARGPKPTPTKLLEQRGSWRAKATDRQGEVQMEPCIPEMPTGLGVYGKEEWERIVPRLAGHQLLTEVDRKNLWLMCKALDEHHQADQEIKKYGLLIDGAQGNKVLNPAVHERHRAWSRYVKHSASFGMSPADRTKVKAAATEEKGGGTGMGQFFPRMA